MIFAKLFGSYFFPARDISEAHKNEFIVMVVDEASSHKSKKLVVPENVTLF
jgi:hypothetical protein